jgi:hypothetical protein
LEQITHVSADHPFNDGAAHADRADRRSDGVSAAAIVQGRARHEPEGAFGDGNRDIAGAAFRIVNETIDRHAGIGADGEIGLVPQ